MIWTLSRSTTIQRLEEVRDNRYVTFQEAANHYIHPHQFRHTYATRLMDQGVPMEHIMALGGWKSSVMAKRYARVNPVHLQKHADRLEELPGHTPENLEPEPKSPCAAKH